MALAKLNLVSHTLTTRTWLFSMNAAYVPLTENDRNLMERTDHEPRLVTIPLTTYRGCSAR